MSERDVMEYDVVSVGAGPAGLAFAIRLKQLKPDARVCVIEKASTVGAQILSGAVIEPEPLDALLPEWGKTPPPVCVPVTKDEFWLAARPGQGAARCRRRRRCTTTAISSSAWVRCAPGWHRRPRRWAWRSTPASPPPNR